ncbi:MAG: alpha/beta fold hydrolase, partial [Siphonobacter sp.]
MVENFKYAGLTVESTPLAYHLNADGNLKTSKKESDVYVYPVTLTNQDVYTVDFDKGNLSNQSAAVKQGYALHFAIKQVLAATGASKVILFGHSMGGIAAREYLQTKSNWQDDGRHHVAKLVTLGTPHQGSNLGTDGLNLGSFELFGNHDESSEAVRDLRESYKTGYRGVYLFGGYENSTYIQRGSFGGSYHNLDVNCNGQEGDYIVGLNQKDIYTDLAYSCVIGQGYMGIWGNSDGVVLSSSQNLNNLYTLNADLFYYNCPIDLSYKCHINEAKKALDESIYALDEPNSSNLAYEVDTEGKAHRGFFTNQSNGTKNDTDRYKFTVPRQGILSIYYEFHANAGYTTVSIVDENGNTIKSFYGQSYRVSYPLPKGGTYYLDISGSSGGGWNSYGYAVSFCPLPEQPNIIANGQTNLCDGQTLILSSSSSYDNYNWLKDGVSISTTNQIQVNSTGTFTLQTNACNPTLTSSPISVKVNPIPDK